jgi:hypothetical protein
MAKEKSSRATHGMGGGGKKSSSKSGKHPHETHIRHIKSGGHIVRHSFKSDADTGEAPEDEEHIMPDKAALMQHLQDTVPDNGAAQAAPPDASAAAPPAAAAAAPPAAAMPPGPVGA